MVSQLFEEIPEIALQFRDDKLGWFEVIDGMQRMLVILLQLLTPSLVLKPSLTTLQA